MKTGKNGKLSFSQSLLCKPGFILVSVLLITGLVSGYFLMPAFGASDEVLNGDGSFDTASQVDSWTLVNNSGTSSWSLDTDYHFNGTGSGKLESPTGSGIDFDSYVYYRFTTAKVPASVKLDLAYKKQYTGGQPASGDWNVYAEIWKVGGTQPLETFNIDNGNINVDFKSIPTLDLTLVKEMNTQYELRLGQKGRTGSDSSSKITAWFDEAKINIDYDSNPPKVISASANTDSSVDVVFDEAVGKASAENASNYSISPTLNITGAALQPDGKTVRLKTDTQIKGTSYTVTVDKVQDISLNTMLGPETADFTGIDTTPPKVVDVKPVTDNKINIMYSEKVDKNTAEDINNYEINPLLNISGASLQADGQTVQLTTDTQTLGTQYSVKVSNVADLTGNIISSDNISTFTGIDTTPPRLLSAAVVDDSTVDLKFSEELDQNSATIAANYNISLLLDVTGAELQADKMTVRLSTSKQAWQTDYTVNVKNISDISGNVISSNNNVNFTGLDTTSPTAVSAKAINDTTVDILFSEKVDAVTAQTVSNFSINQGLNVQNAVIQDDGKTVRLTTSKQAYKVIYSVTVNEVSDLAGNKMNGNSVVSFSGVDSEPPQVVSVSAIDYHTVKVVFSEQIDSVTAQAVNNYQVSESPDNTTLTVKSAILQADGMTVNLATGAQSGGKNYSLNVNGIKDLAGNLINTNNEANFAGISPPVLENPKILSATAPDNATIVLKFSATMDPVTVQNPANYNVTPDLPITGAILQKDGVTVRLTTAVQTSGTIYTVTVANVQDQYGNIIDQQANTASFTGNAKETENPHGRYLSNTNQCAQCHVTHNSPGPNLISQPNQTQLCLLCHDAGGQSKYDVADEFGKADAVSASHHKIPEGAQQCSDCHNPHDGGQDASGNDIHWTRLLQSRADSNVHGGNQFCFSCHKEAIGNSKAINPDTYPSDGVGHNNASFVINGETPFNPASGTDIRCEACHEQHGSSQEKLLKDNPDNGANKITGNDKNLCFKCHQNATNDNRYLGQSTYDNPYINPHSKTSSTNTNVSYPGVSGQAGQCLNCHDPHGTSYGTSKVSMKTLRAPYNDNKNTYTASDFSLCFGCHNNTSANAAYDIQTPYNASEGGHYIKSSGGDLLPGSKMPCEDCHTLHGSENNNKYMLKDDLGSNLGDGRNECLACHRTGKVVEGINMTPPPSGVSGHNDPAKSCLSCHGSSHNPSN